MDQRRLGSFKDFERILTSNFVSFLQTVLYIKQNDGEKNGLPLGLRFCFRAVWDSTEIYRLLYSSPDFKYRELDTCGPLSQL